MPDPGCLLPVNGSCLVAQPPFPPHTRVLSCLHTVLLAVSSLAPCCYSSSHSCACCCAAPAAVGSEGSSGERGCSGRHLFGWRDAMDIVVKYVCVLGEQSSNHMCHSHCGQERVGVCVFWGSQQHCLPARMMADTRNTSHHLGFV